jgi:hypothetical protein
MVVVSVTGAELRAVLLQILLDGKDLQSGNLAAGSPAIRAQQFFLILRRPLRRIGRKLQRLRRLIEAVFFPTLCGTAIPSRPERSGRDCALAFVVVDLRIGHYVV